MEGKEMMKHRNLGQYLKELRESKNLSLEDVVERSIGALSCTQLSHIEDERIGSISPHILHHLAKVYEVPYKDLMIKAGHIQSSTGAKCKWCGNKLSESEDTGDECHGCWEIRSAIEKNPWAAYKIIIGNDTEYSLSPGELRVSEKSRFYRIDNPAFQRILAREAGECPTGESWESQYDHHLSHINPPLMFGVFRTKVATLNRLFEKHPETLTPLMEKLCNELGY